jgi:hypothetical protein
MKIRKERERERTRGERDDVEDTVGERTNFLNKQNKGNATAYDAFQCIEKYRSISMKQKILRKLLWDDFCDFFKISLKFRDQDPYKKAVVNALNMFKKKKVRSTCVFFKKKLNMLKETCENNMLLK